MKPQWIFTKNTIYIQEIKQNNISNKILNCGRKIIYLDKINAGPGN